MDEISPAPSLLNPPPPTQTPHPQTPHGWTPPSLDSISGRRQGGQGRIDDITGKGLRTAVALSTASCLVERLTCDRPTHVVREFVRDDLRDAFLARRRYALRVIQQRRLPATTAPSVSVGRGRSETPLKGVRMPERIFVFFERSRGPISWS